MDGVKAMFRSEELEAVAAIGTQTGPLKDRILEALRLLGDPLLAASEIAHMMHIENGDDVVEALGVLHQEKALEKTTTTTRPLDEEGISLYRLAGVPFSRLKLVGLESKLANGASRYQFTCEGRLIRSIAKVDRLDAISGTGNQRDEIRRHVQNIAKGIGTGTQVPNPVLLVLIADQVVGLEEEGAPESFVRISPLAEFTRVTSPADENVVIQEFRPVQIDFPYRAAAFDEEKSALLVDGQQRTAAISLVDVEEVPHVSLSVNAEVASSEDARAIFMVANSTAKIETQFSRALLAAMDQSPGYLSNERPRAIAVRVLALEDKDSPFYDLVQYPGRRVAKKPPVAYNSLFQVVTTLHESGLPLGDPPEKVLASVIKRGFGLVKKTWPSAWGLRPNESRLMHALGLRAMASLLVIKLESLYAEFEGRLDSDGLWDQVEASIRRLQPHLIWTVADTANALKSAVKTFNEEISPRQNTTQDISALTKTIKRLSLELDTEAHGKKKSK